MPRVAVGRQQKIDQEVEKLASSVLDALNSDKGRRDMFLKDYAPFIGVKNSKTFTNWKKKKLRGIAFDSVFEALIRAGYNPIIVLEKEKKGR